MAAEMNGAGDRVAQQVVLMGFAGVLFDSGDTLIRPVGGRWNPRYDFEEILLRHLPELDTETFPQAFAAGQRLLDAGPATPTRADYHRAILHALGVRRPPPELLEELEQPSARLPVQPFPEVPGVLERLRAGGVGMAIVSDNWPGMEGLYRQLGLNDYFQAFVISAVLGCRKPDPRMYRAGSDALGLPSHECIFVDDDPDLVAAAIELGYGGTAIVRTADPPATVPWIDTLEDLIPHDRQLSRFNPRRDQQDDADRQQGCGGVDPYAASQIHGGGSVT
jgi:HAD superfamily hydrolase (TIGR01509 family)